MIFHIVNHYLGLEGFRKGIGVTGGGLADNFQDHLLAFAHAVPGVFVDQQFKKGGLLMPAGKIIVFGNFVKAEAGIDGWHGELGSLDSVFFKCRENFSTGDKAHGSTQFLKHFATQAVITDFQAFDIFQGG